MGDSTDDYFKAYTGSKLDAPVLDQQNTRKLFRFDFIPAVYRSLFWHPITDSKEDKKQRAEDYAAITNAAVLFNFMTICLTIFFGLALSFYMLYLRRGLAAFSSLAAGLWVLTLECFTFVNLRVVDAEAYEDAAK